MCSESWQNALQGRRDDIVLATVDPFFSQDEFEQGVGEEIAAQFEASVATYVVTVWLMFAWV